MVKGHNAWPRGGQVSNSFVEEEEEEVEDQGSRT